MFIFCMRFGLALRAIGARDSPLQGLLRLPRGVDSCGVAKHDTFLEPRCHFEYGGPKSPWQIRARSKWKKFTESLALDTPLEFLGELSRLEPIRGSNLGRGDRIQLTKSQPRPANVCSFGRKPYMTQLAMCYPSGKFQELCLPGVWLKGSKPA